MSPRAQLVFDRKTENDVQAIGHIDKISGAANRLLGFLWRSMSTTVEGEVIQG